MTQILHKFPIYVLLLFLFRSFIPRCRNLTCEIGGASLAHWLSLGSLAPLLACWKRDVRGSIGLFFVSCSGSRITTRAVTVLISRCPSSYPIRLPPKGGG